MEEKPTLYLHEHGPAGKLPGTERWIVTFWRRPFDLSGLRRAVYTERPAAEVAVYYIEGFKEILVPVLFFFSFVKFTLVVLWFMHLKFDSRTYARFFVMGLAGAITLFLIVLLTFQVFSS